MSATERIEKTLESLVDFYGKEKRKKLCNDVVIHGRGASAASEFELDFARRLFGESKKKKVLVDYPISFGKYRTDSGKTKKKTIYSDILVTEQNFLKGIIEAKIDLGFLNYERYGIRKKNRSYFYEKKHNLFKKDYALLLQTGGFSYRYPVGFKHPKDFHIIIPKDAEVSRILLVVTRSNDHGRYEKFRESVIDSGFCFLCILENTHPNEHPEKNEDLREWSNRIKRKIHDEVWAKTKEIEETFGELLT